MKNKIYLPILLALAGCNSKHQLGSNRQTREVEKAPVADTMVSKPKADNSKYYTKEDTVYIPHPDGYILKYAKATFNNLVDNQPEFFWEDPDNPDDAYNYNNIDPGFRFISESGQDEYYVLYAYFLKQRNGIDKYAERRKKLIDIYLAINEIFANLRHGGTYFGHQSSRILGYAEYDIYCYKYREDKDKRSGEEFYRMYGITKQKDHYIKLLRQLIQDEIKNDPEIYGEGNARDLSEELDAIVDNLDKLITDKFYLQCVLQFQYTHYRY
ncbi:MAG TPA: hypothetical protein VFR70_00010 [Flavobacterium sp.]|nr:hypothetical protein [Flavobacterium sp.]